MTVSEKIGTALAALRVLTPDERLEVFWEYCTDCGRPAPDEGKCVCQWETRTDAPCGDWRYSGGGTDR